MYLHLNSIQYRWDTADDDLQTVDDQELMIFFFFNNMSMMTGLSVGFHASKFCFCFPSQLRPICGHRLLSNKYRRGAGVRKGVPAQYLDEGLEMSSAYME